MILSPSAPPADFDHYWSAVVSELSRLPLAPELTEMPLRSTDFGKVYALRLTSLGGYRIFANTLSSAAPESPFTIVLRCVFILSFDCCYELPQSAPPRIHFTKL